MARLDGGRSAESGNLRSDGVCRGIFRRQSFSSASWAAGFLRRHGFRRAKQGGHRSHRNWKKWCRLNRGQWGAGANDRCGQCHLSLKWVWRGCDTPNPVISRRSKPVRLFVRAGPPLNTVVALLLAVGLRGPQETVIHIARIDVGSGDRAGGVDGYRGGALAGTCTRTGTSNVVIVPSASANVKSRNGQGKTRPLVFTI